MLFAVNRPDRPQRRGLRLSVPRSNWPVGGVWAAGSAGGGAIGSVSSGSSACADGGGVLGGGSGARAAKRSGVSGMGQNSAPFAERESPRKSHGWGDRGEASRVSELERELSKPLVVRLTKAATPMDICVVRTVQ